MTGKPLAVGARAPPIEAKKDDWQDFSLSRALERGPVVLAFFPFAFTSTCTAELCTFSDRLDRFQAHQAQIVGISCDSPYVLRAYRREAQIKTTLVADFTKEIARAYGVLYDDFRGIGPTAKRAVFVVGQDGTVAYAWHEDDPDVEPDYDGVESAVSGLARLK